MNNDLKSANSAKIGKRFYESRVRLNYSVNEVADILFINKDYYLDIFTIYLFS